MTTLTHVTTASAFARTITDATRDEHAEAALSWVARQLRFERLLRSLEEETGAIPANPSVNA